MLDVLIEDVREHSAVVCQRADFKLETLPAHLTMNFKVVDDTGRQLGMGRNLRSCVPNWVRRSTRAFARLRATMLSSLRPRDRHPRLGLQRAARADAARAPRTGWPHGDTRRFPALVDHGDHGAIEVFDDAEEARRQHRAGLRRLFRLQLRDQLKFLEKTLASLQTTQMQAGTVPALTTAFPSFEQMREQVVVAALDRTCLVEPWPRDRAGFLARSDEARGKLSLIAQEIARLLTTIVAEAAGLPKKMNAVRGFPAAIADIEQQLARLFPATSWSRYRQASLRTIRAT